MRRLFFTFGVLLSAVAATGIGTTLHKPTAGTCP